MRGCCTGEYVDDAVPELGRDDSDLELVVAKGGEDVGDAGEWDAQLSHDLVCSFTIRFANERAIVGSVEPDKVSNTNGHQGGLGLVDIDPNFKIWVISGRDSNGRTARARRDQYLESGEKVHVQTWDGFWDRVARAVGHQR